MTNLCPIYITFELIIVVYQKFFKKLNFCLRFCFIKKYLENPFLWTFVSTPLILTCLGLFTGI